MSSSPWLLAASLALATFVTNAHALVFTATLAGTNEVPVTPSAGTGTATVTYDPIAHTLRVQTTFSGLSGLTTAAHIHVPTSAGTNGPVATQIPAFAGFPLGVTAGTYDNTFDLTLAGSFHPTFVNNSGGTVAFAEATLATALQANLAYINIHTSLFGGGEIRGNLAATVSASVPDGGASAWLFLPAVAIVAGVSRRRGNSRVA